MFLNLLKFELFYQLKQRAFPLFALLFLLLGVFIGRQGFAPQGVDFNAPYQIYFHTTTATIGSVFIIMIFAVSGVLRDRQHNMESLIYSSSLSKANYFWSRFLGVFLFSLIAFSPFLVGYIAGNYFFDLDPERVGKFSLITYLQPWLYIVVPNILICSSIIFSVSMLTKNATATYMSAVLIYALYFVSSIFLNSPLLAQSSPSTPESLILAGIADPFGMATFYEQTQFWTAFEKNTQLLSLSGLFLLNRLLWLLLALIILISTYVMFSFRKISSKAVKKTTKKLIKTNLVAYQIIRPSFGLTAQVQAYISLVKLELQQISKTLPFKVVMTLWIGIVFIEIYSTAVSGGEYGVPRYPMTNQLIALFVDPLTIFSLILILYYSAEIIWRERSLGFEQISDSSPTRKNTLFFSKLTAISYLPVVMISIAILISLGFQLFLGFADIQPKLYFLLFYHYGIQLLVFAMISFFIHSWAKTKYQGMILMGIFIVLSLKSDLIGLEHPLTSIGFLPRIEYSNMDGFHSVSNLYDHLSLYWICLGSLLVLLSFKIQHAQMKWSITQKSLLVIFLSGFLGAGALVFYNNNILNPYQTIAQQNDQKEQYEQKYKAYEDLERPIISTISTQIDLYPSQQSYHVQGAYQLKNKDTLPMAQIFISERKPLDSISIEGGHLEFKDPEHGVYLFSFEPALQQGDSVLLRFNLSHHTQGYQEDISITDNGTYINRMASFDPILGYSNSMEIKNPSERKTRNLPPRMEEETSESHIMHEEIRQTKVHFETIISTSYDQIALSSGSLIDQWTKNNRRYYHYKTKEKIMPSIGYFSARYKKNSIEINGISVEHYYDPSHDFNSSQIEQNIQKTLRYCEENFGRYNFDHLRIAEVPSHWPFGGFAHPGMISMTEDKLYLSDQRDSETFDLVGKRTIHEVAHQWWGHTLSAKPVAGSSLFVEGFAKYTEAVVLEKTYGPSAVFTLVEDARSRYFFGRTYEKTIEPALYQVAGQNYISYGKALNVLLALRDLIGEAQVNQVLKTLSDRHRKSIELKAHSLELLNEIYRVSPAFYHPLIDDWFKKVITYDLEITKSSVRTLDDGTYEVTATIKAHRYETLESGEKQEIGFNEPIKIGVFEQHPSQVFKNTEILYYESDIIHQDLNQVKMIVSKKPKFIAIDPYGTRTDENLTDNIKTL